MNKPLISIITATLNSEKQIGDLISDLEQQTFRDFEWVIADGQSGDRTVELLRAARGIDLKIDLAKDFGVYDALNRGLRMASGEYYLVIGSDDRLEHDALEKYAAAVADSQADIISSQVRIDGRIITRKKNHAWFWGIRSCVSSHSIGALIRTSLHDQHGYYSKRFPICADQLFLMQARNGGARIHDSDFIAGEFFLTGLTGNDPAGMICESYRVNISAGHSKLLQTALLILRLIKNFHSIR